MPTGINEGEVIVVLERFHVSRLVPALQVTVKAMQEHERWAFSFDLIMDTDALMSSIWHTSLLTYIRLLRLFLSAPTQTEKGT
jgi:hypothetical protein